MKKIVSIVAVLALFSGSFSSCDTYHSLSSAENISQLASNPFIQNVAKSVVKNTSSMLLQNGVKAVSKIGLNTNLSTLLSTAQAVSGFKKMLGDSYGLSNSIIDRNFNKLSSVRDVVGLVSTMGTKGLNFYMN
jgi:hypothetical protein